MKRAFPTSQRELKSVCHLASLIFWPTQSLTHCSSTHLELMKRTSHPQQHISSQSRLYKGRKGERRRWRVILMNIWQQLFFFPFILLLTACLILIKPILHSRLSDFHWIGWRYLLHSLTLRNKLRVFNTQISRVNYSTLGKASLFQHRGEINGKSVRKKGKMFKLSMRLSP